MASYTLDQDGYSDGGVWDDTSTTMVVDNSPLRVCGLRFTGMPVVTRGSGIPGDGVTYTYTEQVVTVLNISLVVSSVSATAPRQLSLYSVVELDPVQFGPTRLPENLTTVELARLTITGAETPGTTLTFTMPDGNAAVNAVGISRFNGIYRKRGFQGNVAFTLQWLDSSHGDRINLVTDEHPTLGAPTMVTTEFNDTTGMEGHLKAWSRIDRCPRCSKLQPREHFVEDGFKPGLLVCRRCWDEPDFYSEFRGKRVGRETEGLNER